MRIIAGSLGGRTIDAPRGHRTHPMSEKVRGALFNMLGDITGLQILDSFAGSGAIGLEALSRGASQATMLEIDQAAAQVIKNNIQQLGLQNSAKVIRANAAGWSDNNPLLLYDIVICDPPYDQPQEKLIVRLSKHAKPSGVLVCSLPPKNLLQAVPGFTHTVTKDYNDATLVFYHRTG